MLSKLFDSPKGEYVYSKRTICEVNRDIYDKLVIGLLGKNDSLLKLIIPLLEESYLMGLKMNAKLITYKCGLDNWVKENNNIESTKVTRKERIRLIKILEENEKMIQKFSGEKNG